MQELYLVTGACGHLGNTVVRQLLKAGKQVRGLALPKESAEPLAGLDVELVHGDLRDLNSMRPLFKSNLPCEFKVIHTAGAISIASGFQQAVWDVNVGGTANLLKLCKEYGVRRLVHTSSVHAIPERPMGETISEVQSFSPDEVYGLYAKTKAEATQLVLDAAGELDVVVVHPSGIIGPGDYGRGHLTQLIRDYLDGRLAACVDGGYDFVDVRDVAAGAIAAMERGRRGECYILAGGYCSIPDFLTILSKFSGRKPVKIVLPYWLAKTTAPLAEQYYKLRKQPPLYTRYSLYTLRTNADFSTEKARAELGYTPRPVQETASDTINWLCTRNHPVTG